MITIDNVSLVDLLNPKNAKDPTLQSIAVALDLNFQAFYEVSELFCVLPNIMNVTDNATLDYIGLYTLNSPGYSTSLPIAKKQWLIANTIPIKRKRGTKWAIEALLGNLFSVATVQPWYTFGGVPGTFQIQIADLPTDSAQLQLLFDAIYDTKSTRDWFVGFVAFAGSMSMPMYNGMAVGIHKYQVIRIPGG
jgi:hypothetical protein